MSKEKKKMIILTVVLSIIAIVLIALFIVSVLKQNGTIMNSEQREIIDGFNERLNSKNKEVIFYASSSCSFCELLQPELDEIKEEYDMDYYYIDTAKLALKQRNEIMKKLEIEKHETPITVVVEDGKVISKKTGYDSGREYVEFFKEAGVLPEDAEYAAEKNITFIDYNKYEELISDNGDHIIVIGQTTCPHCIAIKPALNSVASDYEIVINYLNITELSEDDEKAFFQSLNTIGYDDEDYLADGSIGTPLTLIIKNNKVSDYFSGERTISQLVREFTKAGFIKEA